MPAFRQIRYFLVAAEYGSSKGGLWPWGIQESVIKAVAFAISKTNSALPYFRGTTAASA